jgi:hypothetical protein
VKTSVLSADRGTQSEERNLFSGKRLNRHIDFISSHGRGKFSGPDNLIEPVPRRIFQNGGEGPALELEFNEPNRIQVQELAFARFQRPSRIVEFQ